MKDLLIPRLKEWLFGSGIPPGALRRVGEAVVENGYTRISYASDYFDLFVWLDANQLIAEFQLCYEKLGQEKVFTWNDKGTLSHRRVDSGKQQRSMSAIYTPNGAFPRAMVSERFRQSAERLDRELVAFVLEKIEAYRGPEV